MANNFTIEISYEGMKKLQTNDFLEALKTSINYEADLYLNGKLVHSCMGLSREDNEESLKQYGIESYLHDNQYRYKYIGSEETPTIYARFSSYLLHGVPFLEVSYSDYDAYNTYTNKYSKLEYLIEEVKLLNTDEHTPDNIKFYPNMSNSNMFQDAFLLSDVI